jgi:hypothetical protein
MIMILDIREFLAMCPLLPHNTSSPSFLIVAGMDEASNVILPG